MKWFRSNIKQGSRLALLALALQFGLSFGHFHAGAAQYDISDAVAQPAPLPAAQHDSDHHPSEDCATCAVISLAKSVLLAPPPVLLLPHAAQFPHLVTYTEFVDPNPVGVAFQPRAPPTS
jgi:hypothetical protein